MFRTLSKLDVMKQQRAQIQIEGLCIRGSLPCVCVCVCRCVPIWISVFDGIIYKKKTKKNIQRTCVTVATKMREICWLEFHVVICVISLCVVCIGIQ